MDSSMVINQQIMKADVDANYLGIKCFDMKYFEELGYTKFQNDAFTIYEKIFMLSRNIEYNFKVYFYENKYFQTGINFGSNVRFKKILKIFFNKIIMT